MSILVAMVDKGTVWIGSDTQITNSGMRLMLEPKWSFAPPWVFGVVGSARAATVMIHKAPEVFGVADNIHQVCFNARGALLGDGFKPTNGDVPGIPEFDMLVANGPRLWWIGDDFSGEAVKPNLPIAIGAGDAYAFGAMMVMQEQHKGPEEVLRAGLRAAMKFSTSCGGEEWVHSIL